MYVVAATLMVVGVLLLLYALVGLVWPRLPFVKTRMRGLALVFAATLMFGGAPHLSPELRREMEEDQRRREEERHARAEAERQERVRAAEGKASPTSPIASRTDARCDDQYEEFS
jgi:hypothetical protein